MLAIEKDVAVVDRESLVAFMVLRRLVMAREANLSVSVMLSVASGVRRPAGLKRSADFFNWAQRMELSMIGQALVPFDAVDLKFGEMVLSEYSRKKKLAQDSGMLEAEILRMGSEIEFKGEGISDKELSGLIGRLSRGN